MKTFLPSCAAPRTAPRRGPARTLALVLSSALAFACGSELEAGKDAEISGPSGDATVRDADLEDARDDADVGANDAGAPLDAGVAPSDAGADDAAIPDASAPDAGWGTCVVDGVAGSCVEVALCTGDQVATPGHCPGPAEIQCCTPRGASSTCDPSVHPAPNLGLVEAPGIGGCPAGMIAVAASPIPFCVDRYEASLVEILADGSTAAWSPYHHPGTRRVRAVSIAGAVPQAYVDAVTASAACAEASKRLCTDAEWLRACRGPSSTVYPYGDTRQPGVCNDARAVHPAIELFPNDPSPFSHLDDACLDQLPDSLDRSGDNPGCITAEGAFDMMGNLHEWTADPAGTFRGGFYVDTRINGNGCLYATTAHDTRYWDYSTGFRCCD